LEELSLPFWSAPAGSGSGDVIAFSGESDLFSSAGTESSLTDFFQNSLPRGREVGPPFSLAASFVVLVDVGFLASSLLSWDIKFALSDLTSDEVAGDFSAPFRVLKKIKMTSGFQK